LPALGAADPLPLRPRRIAVAGTSGSGKSTLARRLAVLLDLPYVEMDSLHHGPGWQPRTSFVAEVEAFTAGPAWVVEWQYDAVRELVAARADLLVFLLYRRSLVMRRVVRRTVVRRLRRTELWNGNQEGPLHRFFTDREHIVRWAWRTHPRAVERYAELSQRGDLLLVGLRSPRQLEAWLAGPLRGAVR
jgi:adenylate kinase family enzyme